MVTGASVEAQGVRIPAYLYGTAWKEDATTRLTRLALDAGFRGIDTANQRRHYFEAGVGQALAQAFASASVRREDLFLQTKFTYVDGQDNRLPYDPAADVATQVQQSFASSLQHLGVPTLDAYLLHGPSTYPGLAQADWEAWRAMESLHAARKVRLIGISNVMAGQLQELVDTAKVRPAIVQNRCFTRPRADADVRHICKAHGIAYEGFSLLTGNVGMLRHPLVQEIASRHHATVAQVIFRYCRAQGMVVLTGTTSAPHMREDLDAEPLELSEDEIEGMRRLVE